MRTRLCLHAIQWIAAETQRAAGTRDLDELEDQGRVSYADELFNFHR